MVIWGTFVHTTSASSFASTNSVTAPKDRPRANCASASEHGTVASEMGEGDDVLPSGYVKIAIENSPFIVDLPIQNGKSWNILSGWWYTYRSEKYEFVSWHDDIPINIWKVIKTIFQTTNHKNDGSLPPFSTFSTR